MEKISALPNIGNKISAHSKIGGKILEALKKRKNPLGAHPKWKKKAHQTVWRRGSYPQ